MYKKGIEMVKKDFITENQRNTIYEWVMQDLNLKLDELNERILIHTKILEG